MHADPLGRRAGALSAAVDGAVVRRRLGLPEAAPLVTQIGQLQAAEGASRLRSGGGRGGARGAGGALRDGRRRPAAAAARRRSHGGWEWPARLRLLRLVGRRPGPAGGDSGVGADARATRGCRGRWWSRWPPVCRWWRPRSTAPPRWCGTASTGSWSPAGDVAGAGRAGSSALLRDHELARRHGGGRAAGSRRVRHRPHGSPTGGALPMASVAAAVPDRLRRSCVGAVVGSLPQRGHPPGAAAAVDGHPGLGLPRCGDADPLVRQHPAAVLAAAARAVPRLPRPDLDPLPPGRGCGRRCWRLLALHRYGLSVAGSRSTVFAWMSLALGLIDLEHQILPDVITYPGDRLSGSSAPGSAG